MGVCWRVGRLVFHQRWEREVGIFAVGVGVVDGGAEVRIWLDDIVMEGMFFLMLLLGDLYWNGGCGMAIPARECFAGSDGYCGGVQDKGNVKVYR